MIELFCQNFFGYGNPKAPVWFIGMEEGGGNTIHEVNNRIEAWDNRGQKAFEDVVDYHVEFGLDECFQPTRPKIQTTWGKLIRAFLVYQNGEDPDLELVRETQRNSWARGDGNQCLTELLPLPSPNVGNWLYGNHFNGADDPPWLANREIYAANMLQVRIPALHSLISRNCPRHVVFYGRSYQKHWHEVAGAPTWKTANFREQELSWAQDGATNFYSMVHSTRGTNALFHALGYLMREREAGI